MCFRPPRDLDSKACVTIGEKVTSFSLTPYLDRNLFMFYLCTPFKTQSCFVALCFSVPSLSLDYYITAECLLSWRCVFGLVTSHDLPTHSCRERLTEHYIPIKHFWLWGEWNAFIALQAVKIFILKSSNKWNFPLAEVPNIFSAVKLRAEVSVIQTLKHLYI